MLDKLLGREISGVFSRQMLVSLINLNVNDPEHAKETDLTANDARLLRGALTYKDRKVGDVMTPLANVFSVSEDAATLWKQIVAYFLEQGGLYLREVRADKCTITVQKDGGTWESGFVVKVRVFAVNAEKGLLGVVWCRRRGSAVACHVAWCRFRSRFAQPLD